MSPFSLLAAVVTAALPLSAQISSNPLPETTSSTETLQSPAAAWVHAVASKDADRIAVFFAEDATAMYPRATAIGREANRQVWAQFFRRPKATHAITSDEALMATSRDLGYTTGTWRASFGEGQDHVDLQGRYVAIWQRAKGEWRIKVFSANAYEPQAARPGPH